MKGKICDKCGKETKMRVGLIKNPNQTSFDLRKTSDWYWVCMPCKLKYSYKEWL